MNMNTRVSEFDVCSNQIASLHFIAFLFCIGIKSTLEGTSDYFPFFRQTKCWRPSRRGRKRPASACGTSSPRRTGCSSRSPLVPPMAPLKGPWVESRKWSSTEHGFSAGNFLGQTPPDPPVGVQQASTAFPASSSHQLGLRTPRGPLRKSLLLSTGVLLQITMQKLKFKFHLHNILDQWFYLWVAYEALVPRFVAFSSFLIQAEALVSVSLSVGE